ncbi:ester cyclase [Rhizocola hellebori]|nr:nuclear transport factor 2 family protein [Rhizocola hellebori]
MERGWIMGQARDVMDRLTAAAGTAKKDIEAIGNCFAEDAIAHTPDHGEIKGRTEIVRWWAQMMEAVPDGRYESVHSYEVGDTAIDEGYLSGTNSGFITMPTGEKLPPTNKRVRLRGCDLATVENGYIVDYRIYFDQMEFLEQLGLAQQS